LLYYGKGYDLATLNEMYPDELVWHCKKLTEQLQEEHRQREAQQRKQKAQTSAARARAKARR